MRKGNDTQVLTIVSNSGSSGSYSVSLDSGYSSGTQLLDAYTCNAVTVDPNGSISVKISSGLPQVLVPESSAGGLCGGSNTASTS